LASFRPSRVEFELFHLFVLAMIDVWDIDPNAPKPPPSLFGQKLAGVGAGTAPLDANEGLGPSLITVCTYGAPPLGPHLFGDASDLMRTFTTPSCADGTTNFQSGFAAQPLFGFFPLAMALPWQTAISPGTPVHLSEPTGAQPHPSALGFPSGFSGPSNIVLHLQQGGREPLGASIRAGSEGRAAQHPSSAHR